MHRLRLWVWCLLLGVMAACEADVPPRQDAAPLQADTARRPDTAAAVGDTLMARDTVP